MKLLAICFEPHEAVGLAGFASALGISADALLISGEANTDLGYAKVLQANSDPNAPADGLCAAIAPLLEGYTHIAGVSSIRSKDLLPRLATKLDAPMVTDVIAVQGPQSFTRPMVAGSIIARVEVASTPIVLSVRTSNFPTSAPSGSSQVETVSLSLISKVTIVKPAQKKGARPDLTQASRVVSGGRPLKDTETFEKLIGSLADKLGGATGATRAAVDSGIAPNEMQVGQTGKIVAPDLYIAAGISGSTQHMAGIKDSKIIVAINKDAGAPIFEVADFGLVADLYDAIPELMSLL